MHSASATDSSPCTALCDTLRHISEQGWSAERELSLIALADSIRAAAPSAAPILADIWLHFLNADFAAALAHGRRLVTYEQRLMHDTFGHSTPRSQLH